MADNDIILIEPKENYEEARDKNYRERTGAPVKIKANALVIDLLKGWGLEYIEAEPVGGFSYYKGQPVHLMVRTYKDGEAVLNPYVRPDKMECLPEKLYRALHWDECKLLFSVKSTLLEKLQVGATIALVVILLFFAFLILSSMGAI